MSYKVNSGKRLEHAIIYYAKSMCSACSMCSRIAERPYIWGFDTRNTFSEHPEHIYENMQMVFRIEQRFQTALLSSGGFCPAGPGAIARVFRSQQRGAGVER